MRFEARDRFAVPAEQLWPLVADTQRLNHAIGLPVMRFTTQPLPTGGSRVIGEHPIGAAALALLGQLVPEAPRWATGDRLLRRLPRFPVVRWIEHPFEWEAPRRYTVLRDYYWSPLALFPFRSFRCGVELLPVGDRATEVTAFADVESRPPLGALVTRLLLGPRNVRRVIRQCRRFEDYLLGRSPEPFPQIARRNDSAARSQRRPPSHDAAGGAGPWQALVGAGVEPDLADRLGRHALEAADEDVVCMRPFELADRWGTDRRETLAAFLHATTAGLLTMMWTVLCPNCRLPKAEYRTLPDLEQGAHCDFCNISFDAALDRQVEVRFSVAPSSRDAADRRFCSGGPMNAPHVVGQAVLAGGEVREVAVPLAPGTYRLRSPQARRAALLEVAAPAVVPAGPLASAAAGAAADGVSVMLASDAVHPPLLAAGVGVVRLRARNDVDVPALLAIERPAWPDTAATAAMVGTLQQFRDLFSSEALAPGLHLAVQRLAFLFTDLTGSTALYQALGQARAFRVVQDHFRLLRRAITGHNGALVKTFGDAVMAVFPAGVDALAAALAMQQDIRQLDAGEAVEPARLLKIGIHEGPCIVVEANGRLDYFGTAVNVASRVEHECQGGEVVLTHDVYQAPAVREHLSRDGADAAPVETHLRGIREPVRLYRITAAPAGRPESLPSGRCETTLRRPP